MHEELPERHNATSRIRHRWYIIVVAGSLMLNLILAFGIFKFLYGREARLRPPSVFAALVAARNSPDGWRNLYVFEADSGLLHENRMWIRYERKNRSSVILWKGPIDHPGPVQVIWLDRETVSINGPFDEPIVFKDMSSR